ncbi:MAG: flagellar hook-length control protein FliK [Desulfurivibrionaceae bacterium]|nr:flagellar hook-length control protein FliK [Desulfurivibrionaceae bacterium]
MSNIINPLLPVAGKELSVDRTRGSEKTGQKFSDHLDRRLHAGQQRREDQLGVRGALERSAPSAQAEAGREAAKSRGPEDEKISQDQGDLHTLSLFLQDLQQVAQEKTLVPGEWTVALPEAEIVADLARQAGMSEADLTALVEQFQAKNSELDLDAFLQALIHHFDGYQVNPAIVVPETELPMLEALLAKMGLNPEQLAQISSQAVEGGGELDLALLGQALEEVPVDLKNLQAIALSPWEAEQLQALLGKAGVSLGGQLELLPERVFGQELVVGFERLQSLLKETVAQAKAAQHQLDLPRFLGSLEEVMKQATFADQSVGFSPVVQGSLGEAYEDLLQMYNQARLRYEEGMGAEEEQRQGDIQKWLAGIVAQGEEGRGQAGEGGKEQPAALFTKNNQVVENLGGGSREEFALPRQDGMTAGQTAADQTIAKPVELPQPVRHFPVQQQQQILNQLSLAVARGMKSGEQHMVLRLHPAELGEVKVDLSLRNEMISVSFTMANSKVKETLEGSMEEFRHNMESKGFSLSDVNVSVGEDQEDPGTWQHFEMAWSGERLQAQNLGDIAGDGLYYARQYVNQEEGVSLFV